MTLINLFFHKELFISSTILVQMYVSILSISCNILALYIQTGLGHDQ